MFSRKGLEIDEKRKLATDLLNVYNSKDFSDICFISENQEIYLSSFLLSNVGYNF
jgi:hypothetical protein